MFHCEVIDNSKEKITIQKAKKFIESQKCGASLYFLGTVRDHNNDKNVTGIAYDSHDVMVKKSFKKIYEDAINKLKLELEEVAQVDQEPSLEGRQLLMFLSPLKKKK